MRGQLTVVYAAVLLALIAVDCGNALKCYWCVGVHCKHAGSGQEIDCNGSCYDMRATLDNGTVHVTMSRSTMTWRLGRGQRGQSFRTFFLPVGFLFIQKLNKGLEILHFEEIKWAKLKR